MPTLWQQELASRLSCLLWACGCIDRASSALSGAAFVAAPRGHRRSRPMKTSGKNESPNALLFRQSGSKGGFEIFFGKTGIFCLKTGKAAAPESQFIVVDK
jgi:hypothetical protein